MTTSSFSPNDEFAQYLKKCLKECEGKPFIIKPFYNKDVDNIEVYLEDVSSYAKWITPEVTVYLAQDDNRIIGFEIAGIERIVNGNA